MPQRESDEGKLRRGVAIVSVDSARDFPFFREYRQYQSNRGIAGNVDNLIAHYKVRAVNHVD